jgi:hypothetical protein
MLNQDIGQKILEKLEELEAKIRKLEGDQDEKDS